MSEYTDKDKTCSHCGGNITPHWAGKIIRWCDNCGSNDKDCPPNVSVEISKENHEN